MEPQNNTGTKSVRTNAGISFIQNHHPGARGQIPGIRLEQGKSPPPTGKLSLCTKPLNSGQNRKSKAPPSGHIVRKFHKYIYKFGHYLK